MARGEGFSPLCVLITGASSGIGAALAEAYARPDVRLCLTGRDGARLDGVANQCRTQGATVETAMVDVADAGAMRVLLTAWDDTAPFDLVLANAGVSAGSGDQLETETDLRHVTAINVLGVLNTLAPLLPRFEARQAGQIGLMASLAGYRGLAGAAGYCASKAWVKTYGEALRLTLAPAGVRVSVICPGFVESRITARNRFPMPMLMTAPKAATIIRRGLARNRARIAFPWPMAAAVHLIAALPAAWADALLRGLPRKT